jgi:hypothetical protein
VVMVMYRPEGLAGILHSLQAKFSSAPVLREKPTE